MKRYFVLLLCTLLLLTSCSTPGKEPEQNTPEEEISTEEEEQTPEEPDEDAQEPKGRNFQGKLKEKMNYQATETDDVPYEPVEVMPNLPAYSVEPGLNNVSNLEVFDEELDPAMRQALEENMLVMRSYEEPMMAIMAIQMFPIYEINDYENKPSFITTDSILHTFHMFFQDNQKVMEQTFLLGYMEELNDILLKDAAAFEEKTPEEIKALAEKNTAYFATVQKVLEQEIPAISSNAEALAEEDYGKIKEEVFFGPSNIVSSDVDYSQFHPRSYYAADQDLTRYFQGMMYYGLVSMPFETKSGDLDRESTRQALMMTNLVVQNPKSFELWDKIYAPTSFFVGESDDLNIFDYGDVVLGVYGDAAAPEDFLDEGKLDEAMNAIKDLRSPGISHKHIDVNVSGGKQFRFMGQRFILDSSILQELTENIVRPAPSGMDVMMSLGSDFAEDILMEDPANQNWEEYPQKLKEQRKRVEEIPEEQWRSNIYNGWLWTLQGLTQKFTEGFPSFMQQEAWTRKDLNTGLGSWAELRHDTVLYAKPSGGERGGFMPPPVKGYVEPNLEVYNKLLWLSQFSKQNLTERELLTEQQEEAWTRLIEVLTQLRDISVKELNNEALTEADYNFIRYYGGALEHILYNLMTTINDERVSSAHAPMPMVVDYHTLAPNAMDEGGIIHAGIGLPQVIYVIAPVEGVPTLTKGVTFRYYEFEAKERLDDETWQNEIMTVDDWAPLYWQNQLFGL